METLFFGSQGPDVKLLQNTLNQIGFSAGTVDGFFGAQTYTAVVAFQKAYGLAADGVVGPASWNALDKYIIGSFTYTVRPGDTINKIARTYLTSAGAILTANPGIDPDALSIGQKITVPFGFDVVPQNLDYTYEIMEKQIQGLKARYPFIELGSAGKSVMGKNLYTLRIGKGANEVSYNASHHANEWITTLLLMRFIENFSRAYSQGARIGNYSPATIYDRSSIYFVPMVNPDGVNVVNYWPFYPDEAYKTAAALNKTGRPIPSVWKANVRGTDLNLNYPAEWDKEHQLEIEQGITGPAPRDYGGPYPLSEPETQGMTAFTQQHNFRLIIAYHTQGKVIYYKFSDLEPPESSTIAQLFSRVSGYSISENPGEASYAGYKDWFIQEYRRPGFTIELGQGVNPLPLTQFSQIYSDNEEILLLGGLV